MNSEEHRKFTMTKKNKRTIDDYENDIKKRFLALPAEERFEAEGSLCRQMITKWTASQQVTFVGSVLEDMNHVQHEEVNKLLKPLLQRDFIALLSNCGMAHIAEIILGYLDADSLKSAELVSKDWLHVINDGCIWKKLIEYNVNIDPIWRGLGQRRKWNRFLEKKQLGKSNPPQSFYRSLYIEVMEDISNIERNWRDGKFHLTRIDCNSEHSRGVYCLQYDDTKIVSGLRDNTIRIWDKAQLKCIRTLYGHTGSVLCLQYNDDVIITGSSDSTIRVWDLMNGEMLNTYIHHEEAVLHLRFDKGMMITCSKDRTIVVWDMSPTNELSLRRVLVGHRAAVNVVDFDDKYIVTASGDRTIKVWKTSDCEFIRTLSGHERGIACLQYRDNLIISGSSDRTIRLWNIESGECMRVLEGHEDLVRCLRFDGNRIVSGSYDGKIKVWDLAAALDPRTPPESICLGTMAKHVGKLFRLQFDEFQIISSSHDDSILIWDFLGQTPSSRKSR